MIIMLLIHVHPSSQKVIKCCFNMFQYVSLFLFRAQLFPNFETLKRCPVSCSFSPPSSGVGFGGARVKRNEGNEGNEGNQSMLEFGIAWHRGTAAGNFQQGWAPLLWRKRVQVGCGESSMWKAVCHCECLWSSLTFGVQIHWWFVKSCKRQGGLDCWTFFVEARRPVTRLLYKRHQISSCASEGLRARQLGTSRPELGLRIWRKHEETYHVSTTKL